MKTLTITRMFVSRMTIATKLLKMCLSNMLTDDKKFQRSKRMPGRHLFCLHISSKEDVINCDVIKLNVENSAKARYLDETHSYPFLNIEIIISKSFMKTMINHRKLCKTIPKYNIIIGATYEREKHKNPSANGSTSKIISCQ